MKTTRTIRTYVKLFSSLLALAALSPIATAATITKANNQDNLELGSSWVGGVVPGSGDIALWDSSVTAGNITTISGTLSFLGISNTGSQSQSINGGTLNLGASGISSSMQMHYGFYAPMNINLAASQTWNLQHGYNNFTGVTVNNAGNTLTMQGINDTGTYLGNITGAGGLTIDTGYTVLAGSASDYTGNTTIHAGAQAWLYDTTGRMNFSIGASGANNMLGGSGTATLGGTFTFDLSGAAANGSWNIVDVASLTESFTDTFSVTGFTDAGGNLWTKVNGGSTYTFNEATGLLTAVPEPSTWALLATAGTFVIVMRRRNTKTSRS